LSTIAQQNRIQKIEDRIAALENGLTSLEAAFSRPERASVTSQCSILEDKVQKLSGEIMALKARMGKQKET
jgi:predicted  nucleic acid-binding Zn-ribbon protein